MRPIPIKLRSLLSAMPRMKMCEMVWFPEFGVCEGRIEFHHVWEYAGTQINEIWAILGACKKHHDMVKTNRKVKGAFEHRSLGLADPEDLEKYPKKDWKQIIKYHDNVLGKI